MNVARLKTHTRTLKAKKIFMATSRQGPSKGITYPRPVVLLDHHIFFRNLQKDLNRRLVATPKKHVNLLAQGGKHRLDRWVLACQAVVLVFDREFNLKVHGYFPRNMNRLRGCFTDFHSHLLSPKTTFPQSQGHHDDCGLVEINPGGMLARAFSRLSPT